PLAPHTAGALLEGGPEVREVVDPLTPDREVPQQSQRGVAIEGAGQVADEPLGQVGGRPEVQPPAGPQGPERLTVGRVTDPGKAAAGNVEHLNRAGLPRARSVSSNPGSPAARAASRVARCSRNPASASRIASRLARKIARHSSGELAARRVMSR